MCDLLRRREGERSGGGLALSWWGYLGGRGPRPTSLLHPLPSADGQEPEGAHLTDRLPFTLLFGRY